MLQSVSLQATHMVAFISKRLSPLVSNISFDIIATGFKNMVGNKGAVKIKFDFVDKTLVFINCHLHSGQNGVGKRNNDVMQIMSRFVYGYSTASQIVPDVQLPDILVLFGDLNYRVNGYKKSVVQAIEQDHYELLINCDQLKIEQTLGNIPRFFQEGKIAFAPTFKRKPYDNLTYGLKRNPSWTDRILFHCSCEEEPCKLEQLMYDSHNLVDLSDHRPVFAQFLLHIDLGSQGTDSEQEGPEEK